MADSQKDKAHSSASNYGRFKLTPFPPHKRSLAKPLVEYQALFSDRDEAMSRAYHSGAYTMAEIGQHFGVHYMTVSLAVKKFESKR